MSYATHTFRKSLQLFPALALALLPMFAISGENSELEREAPKLQGKLKAFGATESAGLLAAFAAKVCPANPELRLSIETLESSEAVMDELTPGSSTLGIVEVREVPKGSELILVPFAYKGIALVVNEENSIEDISLAQFESIMDGRFQNWSDIGGRQGRISIVIPDDLREPETPEMLQISFGHPSACGCSSCEKRRKYNPMAPLMPEIKNPLMQFTQERALSLAAQDKAAISLVDLSNKPFRGVKFLKVDGFAPSVENLLSSKYPLVKVLCIALPKDAMPSAIALAGILSGNAFPELIREKGFIPCPAGK